MCACEGLLLDDESEATDRPITESFGRRAAVLLAEEFDDLALVASHTANMYRLRSRLVHGQLRLADLNDDQRDLLPQARALLRVLILSAIAADAAGAHEVAFRERLEPAFADRGLFAALRAEAETYS